MKPLIVLRGGYKGIIDPDNPDPDANDRDIELYETILSGNIGDATLDDNSFVVVRAGTAQTPVNQSAVLDGFTITGGYRFDAFGGDDAAGLFVPEGSNPTVQDCIITGNAVPDDKRGAGVFVETDNPERTTLILRCTITGNEGGGGAEMAAVAAVVRLEDCAISENNLTPRDGASYGAGFLLAGGSDATFVRCEIRANTWNDDGGEAPQPHGGGGAVVSSSYLLMRNCRVADNALNGGNAAVPICRGGGIAVVSGTADLVNTHFDGNVIGGKEGFGGGLFLAGGDSRVVNCVISGNQAGVSLSDVPDGGGVYVEGAALGQMTNTLLYGNFAARNGGGLHADDGPIVNTTIVNNSAGVRGGGGFAGPGAVLQNCILWNNAHGLSGEVWQAQLYPADPFDLPTVTYSCIQDGSPGGTIPFSTTGNPEHNIDLDPDFYDTSSDNYRLSACSPAIDAANTDDTPADALDVDDSMTTAEKTPDLDLRMRVVDDPAVVDTGNGDPVVDMGSYEFFRGEQGDVNQDGVLDGRDIQPFTDCWLVHGPSPGSVPIGPCAMGDMDLDRDMDDDDKTCSVAALILGETCDYSCTPGLTVPDCNNNGVWDATDIRLCDAEVDPGLCDCNRNGIPDECDIADCESDPACGDVNSDGVPDGCQPDCNSNSVPDDWDIAQATSEDCDENGDPDECQMAAGGDCDGNEVLDACEAFDDCDEDGIPDACEDDCDGNEVPDDCELEENDCNANGYLDACDLEIPPPLGSFDCNENGVPDECDIAACESEPNCDDCNENGVPDACDIAAELSEDGNENGIPDECEQQSMMGGGPGAPGSQSQSSSGGGISETEFDADAAWAEFYEWYFEQDFSGMNGKQRFGAIAKELSELGLPIGSQ